MFIKEDELIKLFKNDKIKLQAYRLMLYLIAISNKNGEVKKYSRNDIIEKTGFNKSQLSRGFSMLEEEGIIYRTKGTYYFNEKLIETEIKEDFPD